MFSGFQSNGFQSTGFQIVRRREEEVPTGGGNIALIFGGERKKRLNDIREDIEAAERKLLGLKDEAQELREEIKKPVEARKEPIEVLKPDLTEVNREIKRTKAVIAFLTHEYKQIRQEIDDEDALIALACMPFIRRITLQ